MNNEQINELLKQLQEQWAPELLATASRIVFWDSVGWLAIGLCSAICCSIFVRWSYRLERERTNSDAVDGIALTGVAAIATGIPVVLIFLNIWNWVALFDPQLAVAHRVFEALMRGR